jgi:hypothetical protein
VLDEARREVVLEQRRIWLLEVGGKLDHGRRKLVAVDVAVRRCGDHDGTHEDDYETHGGKIFVPLEQERGSR